jgi:hypothetical protein
MGNRGSNFNVVDVWIWGFRAVKGLFLLFSSGEKVRDRRRIGLDRAGRWSVGRFER